MSNTKASDRVGQVFGRLTVKSVYREGRRTYAVCDCSCGTRDKHTRVDGLTSGVTISCGCYSRENNGMKTHGRYKDRVYSIWGSLIARTTNKAAAWYADYGKVGRGVCDGWRNFECFLEDMGEPPTVKHSIDRIDNSLGYSKGNCRWTTDSIQAKNQGKRSPSTSSSQYKGVVLDSRYKGCWSWSVTKNYKTVRGSTGKDELLAARCFNFCTKALYGVNVELNLVDELELTVTDAQVLCDKLTKVFGDNY